LILRVAILFGCALGIAHPAMAQLSKFGEPGCEKCKQGEYRERITDTIPSGDEIHGVTDPPCGNPTSTLQTVGNALTTAVKTYSGNVDPKALVGTLGDVSNRLGIGGSVGSFLGQYGAQYARCKAVCIGVPQDAVVIGTAYQINTLFPENMPPGTMHDVLLSDSKHGVTDFAHIYPPVTSSGAVCSIVSNWAGGYQRTVIMDAFFTSTTRPIEAR